VTGPAPIRLLVLSPIPELGAGCRFRIAQFIPYLEAHGFDVTLRTLFTTDFFRLVYRPGRYVRKAVSFSALTLRHFASLRDASQFDVVFIYREVLPIGPPLAERLLTARARPAVVFDFDDAIYLPSVSEANRLIGALKMPRKVETIVRRSRHVIAGNEHLASYARRFNPAVTMIPTCVDTSRFVPAPTSARRDPPVVGWIGSPTTAPYLRSLAPVLERTAACHPFVFRASGTGEPFQLDRVHVDNQEWSLDREVELFNTCDVGVYPLADDEWARGKCGFKAIQFMACGVPVVASPVGVNRDIIQDGVNGFLASNEREWTEKLGRLLSDAALRRRFAEAGRATIEARYSLLRNAPLVEETLRRAAQERTSG
jgi:glycosyltransferase involved in cell wall biosynthesis